MSTGCQTLPTDIGFARCKNSPSPDQRQQTSSPPALPKHRLMRFTPLTLAVLLFAAGCSSQNPTAAPAPIVQDMIADITIPESLDLSALPKGNEDSDRYQLGLQVTRTITCTWLGQWVQAVSADDQANINRAEQAMNDSHDWAILNEMSFTGDWPKAIWLVADAMNSRSRTLNSVPIADTYQATLGCQN